MAPLAFHTKLNAAKLGTQMLMIARAQCHKQNFQKSIIRATLWERKQEHCRHQKVAKQ